MQLSRSRCGCDCLNEVKDYPINKACYPDEDAAVPCCPSTPMAPKMVVLFAGDSTLYEINRRTDGGSVWDASPPFSLGGGVTLAVTLTCDGESWVLRRQVSGASPEDVTYTDVALASCAPRFSLTFTRPDGSSAPLTVDVAFQIEEPEEADEDFILEHTCCDQCPDGSPTFYLVDFGCAVVAGPDPVTDYRNLLQYQNLKIIAPRTMRLTRDCLFGDAACQWTARSGEDFTGELVADSQSVIERWRHLNGSLEPGQNFHTGDSVRLFGCDCDQDPRFDAYPKLVDANSVKEKWGPQESVSSARSQWQCKTCGQTIVSTTYGNLTVDGVHSQGECEFLNELSGFMALGSTASFELAKAWWTLTVAGSRTTLQFTGLGFSIIYYSDEWNCLGKNTMRLLGTTNPEGWKVTPPSSICVVPALSVRPTNPCETKEQQCACCDPGWDFASNLTFQCGSTPVTFKRILPRQAITTLSDDSAITAPCGAFQETFSGSCVIDEETVTVILVVTTWCDGEIWKVATCCQIDGGPWICSTQDADFDCLCSNPIISFGYGGGCCCLFEPPEPEPGIITDCCPDGVSSALTVSLSGSGCADFTTTVTWEAARSRWEGSVSICGLLMSVTVQCETGTGPGFVISVDYISPLGGTLGVTDPIAGDCDPFLATQTPIPLFFQSLIQSCCGGATFGWGTLTATA